MQRKIYNKESVNKLFVVKKPMFISSNFYLKKIKRKYKNKKAGFSGTLDPFASGCLIVAFGQYTKLFKYFSKTPKTYRAVLWLGVSSPSLDIENIEQIDFVKELKEENIKSEISKLVGKISYTPPKYSAKKINGKRAYELARNDEEIALKQIEMQVFETKFIGYSHPFITFEASVSEGAYIRSLAQILAQNLKTYGTLCCLNRINEGKFFYDFEKELNPLEFINLPKNDYFGCKEWLEFGKKISIEYLENKNDGKYLLEFDDFFSIIEVQNNEVKYLINKVAL